MGYFRRTKVARKFIQFAWAVLPILIAGCAAEGQVRIPIFSNGPPYPFTQVAADGTIVEPPTPSTKPPPPRTLSESLSAYLWRIRTCDCKQGETDKKDKEDKKNGDDKKNGTDPDNAGKKDDDKNGKDKEKNGDDKDKDKKEEMQKILQLVAEGKMTVEQALAKLAEKNDDDKEDKKDDDKDKEKEEDKFKLLPEGWNFHAQTTIIPSLDRRIRCQVLRSQQPEPESPTARERLAQTFISACRYGTVPSFTRICFCGRASA